MSARRGDPKRSAGIGRHPERSDAEGGERARRHERGEGERSEESAGGVVFRRRGNDTLFLLIRDSYHKWGFPKGHLKDGEPPERAALREVGEETGLASLTLKSEIDVIDWHFRFRGRQIHKVCHFYLMETASARTKPQRSEGITACRWARYEEAAGLISYLNAKAVLERAYELLRAG